MLLPRDSSVFIPFRGLIWALTLAILAGLSGPALAQTEPEDQAAEAPAADPAAAQPAYQEFHDFVHFARIGRFDAAQAAATQLLSLPDLDPVKLLKAAETDPRAIDTLLLIVNRTEISTTAQKVLDVIRKGEYELRRDPARIRENIDKLGGPPQMEHNAIQRLKESGEYAIPWMIDALGNANRKALWPRIVRALPQIGRGAVRPLVEALETENGEIQRVVAQTLGELGYVQAAPYLRRLMDRPDVLDIVKQAAADAIEQIERNSGRTLPTSAAIGFTQLADRYYNEDGSVQADPRLTQANLWYLRDGFLQPVVVPTEIFGSVMAMRCTEQALRLAPDNSDAIALWLAANIRREARLGMDVESGEPNPELAGRDPSTPSDFPRSIYFARTAGPRHCHAVLERAVRDRDSAVALGAIAALHATAGATSLVGTEDYKQPLVQALQFPDRVVRIKAALALSDALPQMPFAGAELVPPVLSEALHQPGSPQYVVIDSDEENLNRVMGALRAKGATVLGGTDFYGTLKQTRETIDQVAGFFLATDAGAPDLPGAVRQIRDEFRFAATPIVLLVRPAEISSADQMAQQVKALERVDASASADEMESALRIAEEETGRIKLEPATALQLAIQTAEVLRRVALNGRTVINVDAVEPALIAALGSESEELQTKTAGVLSLCRSAQAQDAVAQAALNADRPEALRIEMFAALAESAKNNGNKLEPARVAGLIQVSADDPVMNIRTAASKALGALNLSDNRASEIIRKYYPGG
ncbi:MAG: HEAT repeat domain-containing protein [Phycisphaerae bacterium]|nr:HEAT repeat domain-containing protein [Phycisphaerae bacterium]